VPGGHSPRVGSCPSHGNDVPPLPTVFHPQAAPRGTSAKSADDRSALPGAAQPTQPPDPESWSGIRVLAMPGGQRSADRSPGSWSPQAEPGWPATLSWASPHRRPSGTNTSQASPATTRQSSRSATPQPDHHQKIKVATPPPTRPARGRGPPPAPGARRPAPTAANPGPPPPRARRPTAVGPTARGAAGRAPARGPPVTVAGSPVARTRYPSRPAAAESWSDTGPELTSPPATPTRTEPITNRVGASEGRSPPSSPPIHAAPSGPPVTRAATPATTRSSGHTPVRVVGATTTAGTPAWWTPAPRQPGVGHREGVVGGGPRDGAVDPHPPTLRHHPQRHPVGGDQPGAAARGGPRGDRAPGGGSGYPGRPCGTRTTGRRSRSDAAAKAPSVAGQLGRGDRAVPVVIGRARQGREHHARQQPAAHGVDLRGRALEAELHPAAARPLDRDRVGGPPPAPHPRAARVTHEHQQVTGAQRPIEGVAERLHRHPAVREVQELPVGVGGDVDEHGGRPGAEVRGDRVHDRVGTGPRRR
jgi:hypothetical protein